MMGKRIDARGIGWLCLTGLLLFLPTPAVSAQPEIQRLSPDEIELLVREGSEGALEKLETLLHNGDDMERYYAAQGLGTFANPRAVDILLAAYPEERMPQITSEMLYSLGKQGDPRAVPMLTEALRDYGKRGVAAKGLLRSGDRSALPYLQSLVDSENYTDRWFAIEYLGKFKADNLKRTLLGRLDLETNPNVFREVCRQIQNHAVTEAVPSLLTHSQDAAREKRMRLAAVRTLGALKAEEAQAVMERLLTDTDPDLRVAAAAALERIAPTEAVRPAGAVLGDPRREEYQSDLDWSEVPNAAGYLVTVCTAMPRVRDNRVIPSGVMHRTKYVKDPRVAMETGDGAYYVAVEAIVPDMIKRRSLIVGRSAGLVASSNVKRIQAGLTPEMRVAIEAVDPGVPLPEPRPVAITMAKTENITPVADLLADPEAKLGQVVVLRAAGDRIGAFDPTKCPFNMLYRNDSCLYDGTGLIPVAGSGGPLMKDMVVVGQVQKTYRGDFILLAIAIYND